MQQEVPAVPEGVAPEKQPALTWAAPPCGRPAAPSAASAAPRAASAPWATRLPGMTWQARSCTGTPWAPAAQSRPARSLTALILSGQWQARNGCRRRPHLQVVNHHILWSIKWSYLQDMPMSLVDPGHFRDFHCMLRSDIHENIERQQLKPHLGSPWQPQRPWPSGSACAPASSPGRRVARAAWRAAPLAWPPRPWPHRGALPASAARHPRLPTHAAAPEFAQRCFPCAAAWRCPLAHALCWRTQATASARACASAPYLAAFRVWLAQRCSLHGRLTPTALRPFWQDRTS